MEEVPPPAAPVDEPPPASTPDPACVLSCGLCGRVAFAGGKLVDVPGTETEAPDREATPPHQKVTGLPFTDGVEYLAQWADKNCQRPDCPSNSAALEAARAQDPVVLAAQVAELQARFAQLTTKD